MLMLSDYLRLVQTRTRDDPTVMTRLLALINPDQFTPSPSPSSGYAPNSDIASMEQTCIPMESVEGVVEVLSPYPELVLALNDFLPKSVDVGLSDETHDGTFIVTRSDTGDIYGNSYGNNFKNYDIGGNASEYFHGNETLPQVEMEQKPTLESAKEFLQFVRDRCVMSRKPMLYRRFKDVLLRRRADPSITVDEVIAQVQSLLSPAYSDVLQQFNEFLLPHHRIHIEPEKADMKEDVHEAPPLNQYHDDGHVMEMKPESSPYIGNNQVHLPSMVDSTHHHSYDTGSQNTLQSLVDAATLLYPQ